MIEALLLFVLFPVFALILLLLVRPPRRGYPAAKSSGKLPKVPPGPAPGAK